MCHPVLYCTANRGISGTIAQKHELPPALEMMLLMVMLMTSRRNALEVTVAERAEEERLSALGEDLLWGKGRLIQELLILMEMSSKSGANPVVSLNCSTPK